MLFRKMTATIVLMSNRIISPTNIMKLSPNGIIALTNGMKLLPTVSKPKLMTTIVVILRFLEAHNRFKTSL